MTQQSSAPAITIYSTAVCPYCVAAKNFLKSKGLSWTEVRVDLDPAERQKMMDLTRRTSVPQIFIGDEHIGGFEELQKLDASGELAKKLSYSGDPDDLRTTHV